MALDNPGPFHYSWGNSYAPPSHFCVLFANNDLTSNSAHSGKLTSNISPGNRTSLSKNQVPSGISLTHGIPLFQCFRLRKEPTSLQEPASAQLSPCTRLLHGHRSQFHTKRQHIPHFRRQECSFSCSFKCVVFCLPFYCFLFATCPARRMTFIPQNRPADDTT